jgi:hypothetical protein
MFVSADHPIGADFLCGRDELVLILILGGARLPEDLMMFAED